VTTAAEYREYARECMEAARNATTDAVRQHCLELAKLWTTAALTLDGRVGGNLTASRVNGPTDSNEMV
jgi:hypothetical protein